MATKNVMRRCAGSTARGQLIPLMALAIIALVGMAALAVDAGYWRYQQRLEQTAADSAAIAGAGEIYYPAAADITAAAQKDAASNGFADGVANTTVTVNHPPQSGPLTGNDNAVEVIVKKTQPAFFANLFSIGSQDVVVRAVAALSSTGGGCVYVRQDLTLHGGGRGGITTSPLCGLVINGNMTVTGNANVDVSFASYAGSGPGGGSYPHGQPSKGVAASDPCPRLPGCAYLLNLPTTNPALFSAPCQDAGGVLPGTPPGTSMPPGRYCTAITSDVTLAPGLFIFDKGPPTGALGGTDVTLYNNCTPSGGKHGTTCDVTLSGGSVNDSIVAPTTGVTAGMAYFQPPSLSNSFTFNGASGTVSAIGGVYAPGGTFTFNGQLPTISFLVSGNITMNGSGLNAGSTAGGFPTPGNAVLAE